MGSARLRCVEKGGGAVQLSAPSLSRLATKQWSPTSSHLAVTSWDNKVRVWEIQRGAGNAPVGGVGKLEFDAGAPLLDLAWKEDGQHVFLGGCAKTVKLWSMATNTATDVGSVSALRPRRFELMPEL